MGRRIHLVIILALVVVIALLYREVRDLRTQISSLQAQQVNEKLTKLPTIPRISVDPLLLNFGPLTASVPRDVHEVSTFKGMKADELELRERRIEFIYRCKYQFTPDDRINMNPPWTRVD